MKHWVFAKSVLAAIALSAGTALGQGFPERPITLIVPAPPGGGTDVFARQLAEIVEPILKQKVVVENKAGGRHRRHDPGHGGAARRPYSRLHLEQPADNEPAHPAGGVHAG